MRSFVPLMTLAPLCLSVGCGGHSSRSATAQVTTAAPVTSSLPAPVVSQATARLTATLQAIPDRARLGPDVLALALELRVTSATTLEALALQASGSLDERELGRLRVVEDLDGDGLIGPEDRPLATLETPFAVDDGAALVPFAQPLALAPEAPTRLLVSVETPVMGRAAYAWVGQSLALALPADGLDAALELVVEDDPERLPVTLFLHDHALITEVACTPGFVEIANPTADPIDLSQMFLTGADYANVPAGEVQGASGCHGSSSAFVGRFPPGATLAPGQVATVAIQGDAFLQAFEVEATYAFRKATPGSQTLLTFDKGAWVARDASSRVAIGCDAGTVTLFAWDGRSDLVRDVDMVSYGNARRIDKSEVSVDGPDADKTPSTYLPDTAAAAQQPAPAPGKSASLIRVSHTELGEAALAGNGVLGHDETSEPWGTTFATGPASPGVVD